MKRILVVAVCLLVTLLLISGTVFAKVRPKRGSEHDENDFENFKTIITSGIFDFDTEFVVVPDGYNYHPTEHQGTMEYLYYDTDVYEDGKTYRKFCAVYLPYGYDPEDKETKYNVLYFQHGNAQSPIAIWERAVPAANSRQLIDNLFDPDHRLMEPFIIINPTYYFDADENTMYMDPPDSPSGDSLTADIAGNYYKEVVEDLIPQIESRYNVYCEDFSEEGIKASRNHRAWAGYSRGCACTWYMFYHDLEYFGSFVPMSCPMIREGIPLGGENSVYEPEEAYAHIEEAISSHPDLDFFIYSTCGGAMDEIGQGLIPQMQEFMKHPETFSYGTDPEADNFCFTVSEFDHMDAVMPFTLYNARDILFQ